jgi:hypothetical protein
VAFVTLAVPTGCELTEVVTPEAEERLVVEAVLRPELMQQRVLLHRAIVGGAVRPEPNAIVVVRDDSAAVEYRLELTERSDLCMAEIVDVPLPAEVSCYLSGADDEWRVVPGRAYSLTIRLPDGGLATGRTEVPATFEMRVPPLASGSICLLSPAQTLPLSWTRSRGAWAYILELEVTQLQSALPELVDVPDRIRLTGLGISETDTTKVLPTEFGLFQRTLYDQELLLALRDGLPAGAMSKLVVAAVDRNYVNSVRGGIFNPSGRVRIPSVQGAATGMFGSATTQTIFLRVGGPGSGFSPCR